MVSELNISLNGTSLTQALWQGLPPEFTGSVSFLMTLAKVAGIAFLIYLGFLIVKSIVQTRQALRIKSIEQNVKDINRKLDILTDKKSKEDKKK